MNVREFLTVKQISHTCLLNSGALKVILALSVLFGSISAKSPEFNLSAMDPPSVDVRYSEGPLQMGSSLYVFVRIDSGWYINANVVTDEFLLPTKIQVEAPGIEFNSPIWPQPRKKFNDALQLETWQFLDTFSVVIPVKEVRPQADSLGTQVTLTYQACSGSICLAPTTVVKRLNDFAPVPAKKKDSDSQSHSLILLLLFAFLGGLILNLMPCVLPVLSIKALSLAKHARESKAKVLQLGIAMTFGILVSFWTLATVVISVQKAGGFAGWGFQFQNPAFLVGMTVLITLFALNMFGVFEIWLPSSAQTGLSQKASRKGLIGAFLNGVLMTLLSTPCSAPFLGSAMGFAFTQPPALLFLFFTLVGLGLAFPYMMLSLFPSSLRWIPKPGNWMIHFKQFLGFLMLITAVWLLWVLGRQVGIQAMGVLLLLLVAIGFGAWVLGLLAAPGNPFWKVVLGWMVVAAIGFGGWVVYMQPMLQAPAPKVTPACDDGALTPDSHGWLPWSPALIANLQAYGKTIFVDFTADWCLTCKTNEVAVLQQDTIQNAFAQLGVILVRADFTRPDSAISHTLKSFGKSGVPLYVIYPAHEPAKPIVLSEILTVSQVLDGLMKAGPSVP